MGRTQTRGGNCSVELQEFVAPCWKEVGEFLCYNNMNHNWRIVLLLFLQSHSSSQYVGGNLNEHRCKSLVEQLRV